MKFTARARRHLLVLLGYFALALVLTWPLVLQFTTHVAGDGSDDPALAWNLWWVPHALLNLNTSPIYTHALFYPIGLNLGYYTLTYLNAFAAIPIQFVFGLVPAANVNLLLSFGLSGFGTYLLVEHLLREQASGASRLAAFAAGLLYAFSSNKLLYASLGQVNIASSQWIPFYLLYLLKLFPPRGAAPAADLAPRYTNGVLLGLFLLFQVLSEMIFASFLVLFTAAYLAYWLVAHRLRISHFRRRSANLAIAALLFLLPLTPVLAAMFSDMQSEGDFIQNGLGFSNSFSADLLGFIIPSHLHSLFGSLEAQFHFAYINFAYIGFVPLALGLFAVWRVRPARIWGLFGALIWLITLGPTLRINGAEYTLPFLPFNLLLQIPLVRGNRYPGRWSVMLTLCAAVLMAYGLVELWKILNTRRLTPYALRLTSFVFPSAFIVLLLFEHLSLPLPTTDLSIPEIYRVIAREPGDFAVMELPLTWRNGFRVTGSYRADSQAPIDREFMLAQWYQTAHGHPILNGNTSRNPELKFQYFAETPVLSSLVAIQTGHSLDEATLARDRELAPRVLRFFGVRYVIWHTPYEAADREVANRTRGYVEQVLPVTKISESYEGGRGMVVYRVNELPPDDVLVIKPNDPLARLYFGEGWSAVGQERVWAERSEARVFIPLSAAQDVELTIPFAVSSQAPTLAARVNGRPLALAQPSPGRAEVAARLPAAWLHAGVNELALHFDAVAPLVLTDSPGLGLPIGRTGVKSSVAILVRSAGEEQGNFGHIYVNGVDESPNGRGYDLVVINPQTGKVEARANFDTFVSESESERLAAFVAAIPDGRIVAAAVADEASFKLTDPAVQALRELGGQADLRGKFRWSHALIGVKGAAPGTALEAASETLVSQLIVGLGATEPRVAASISEIRIESLH